jgi:thioredoxin
VKELDVNGFGRATASGTVVVDFYTETCAPCRQMAPVVAEVESRKSGVVFFKVNAQQHPDLASRFVVRSVPTFLVMHGGTVKGQKSGTMTAAQMERWIDGCLGS